MSGVTDASGSSWDTSITLPRGMVPEEPLELSSGSPSLGLDLGKGQLLEETEPGL